MININNKLLKLSLIVLGYAFLLTTSTFAMPKISTISQNAYGFSENEILLVQAPAEVTIDTRGMTEQEIIQARRKADWLLWHLNRGAERTVRRSQSRNSWHRNSWHRNSWNRNSRNRHHHSRSRSSFRYKR